MTRTNRASLLRAASVALLLVAVLGLALNIGTPATADPPERVSIPLDRSDPDPTLLEYSMYVGWDEMPAATRTAFCKGYRTVGVDEMYGMFVESFDNPIGDPTRAQFVRVYGTVCQ